MEPKTIDQLFEDAKTLAKSHPSDIGARSALWQIFAARGEFDRARKQLDLIAQLDSSWMLEVGSCHGLIAAEENRTAIFRGSVAPTCLGSPPTWFAQIVAALPLLAQGRSDDAMPLLRGVYETLGARAGVLNGERFEWICDGDARLGPCLEVIVQGQLFWVPWESVRSLETREPTEIRDRLWQQAMVELTEEGPVEAFIPVRYPAPRNDSETMARVTAWETLGSDLYLGFGQKCYVTDQAQVGFLDVRRLQFDSAELAQTTQTL